MLLTCCSPASFILFTLQQTSLVHFIGVISVVPFFGGSFTTVFPWFIFVIALMTLLNIWGIVGRMLNMERFRYVSAGQPGANNDEAHQEIRDAIAEGRRMIENHVRNAAREREQLALNMSRAESNHRPLVPIPMQV